MDISPEDPLGVTVGEAIRAGRVDELKRLLVEIPGLARARIVDACGVSRTLLHVVADWPGHFPNGAITVAVLVEAGADVNARVMTPDPHKARETAAYLLDRGAELNWVSPWDHLTPLDAARRTGADELVGWLRSQGAMSACEVGGQPSR